MILVIGDLADEGSLVTAMAGIDKVFVLSSPHPHAVSWHRHAIDAAQVTGTVERVTGRPARSLDDLLAEISPARHSAHRDPAGP